MTASRTEEMESPKDADHSFEKVAVIMPAWNAARTIGDSITSALLQSHRNIELIISDDGSQDDTVEIAETHAKHDPRITVIRNQESTGPASARNRALEAGTGIRWIAFLDSDDIWHPDKLRQQLMCAYEHDAGIMYTSFWRMNNDMTRFGKPVRVPSSPAYGQLLKNTAIATSTVLLDTQKTGKVRMIPGQGHEDFELWTRLMRAGDIARGIKHPLMCYRIADGSVSSKRTRMSRHTWDIIRTQPDSTSLKSTWRYANYAFRAAWKHWHSRPRFRQDMGRPQPFDMLKRITKASDH